MQFKWQVSDYVMRNALIGCWVGEGPSPFGPGDVEKREALLRYDVLKLYVKEDGAELSAWFEGEEVAVMNINIRILPGQSIEMSGMRGGIPVTLGNDL